MKTNEKKEKPDKKENVQTKAQIAELKQEKKKMQEELDELQGKTAQGKAVCAVVFLGVVLALFGIFLGLVKLNVGNFASDVLAPAIADVPVVRSILSSDLQKKSSKEIVAEQAAETAKQTSEAAASEAAASEEAAAKQASEIAASEAAAASEIAASEMAASEAAAASEIAASEQAASEEAALADYVDTYSNMKPKTAAQIFDNMMTNQSNLVVKILSNMTPDNRAAIISNMSVGNASQVTVMMEQ